MAGKSYMVLTSDALKNGPQVIMLDADEVEWLDILVENGYHADGADPDVGDVATRLYSKFQKVVQAKETLG